MITTPVIGYPAQIKCLLKRDMTILRYIYISFIRILLFEILSGITVTPENHWYEAFKHLK